MKFTFSDAIVFTLVACLSLADSKPVLQKSFEENLKTVSENKIESKPKFFEAQDYQFLLDYHEKSYEINTEDDEFLRLPPKYQTHQLSEEMDKSHTQPHSYRTYTVENLPRIWRPKVRPPSKPQPTPKSRPKPRISLNFQISNSPKTNQNFNPFSGVGFFVDPQY